MPRSYVPWTKRQIRKIEDLYRQGYSDAYIAAEVGHTVASVKNVRWKRRLLRGTAPYSDNEVEAVKRALEAGYSSSTISRSLFRGKRSPTSIRTIAKRTGLRNSRGKAAFRFAPSDDEWREILGWSQERMDAWWKELAGRTR